MNGQKASKGIMWRALGMYNIAYGPVAAGCPPQVTGTANRMQGFSQYSKVRLSHCECESLVTARELAIAAAAPLKLLQQALPKLSTSLASGILFSLRVAT